jgi:hypothetical protein
VLSNNQRATASEMTLIVAAAIGSKRACGAGNRDANPHVPDQVRDLSGSVLFVGSCPSPLHHI